jgi:nondiscriminating glutamyl-tRNA synthetase
MVNYLTLLSWHPADDREKFSLDELIEEFDIERVSKSPAIFDMEKLKWLNGLYIRELAPAELYRLISPYLERAGVQLAPVQREVLTEAIQPHLEVLGEAARETVIFLADADATTSPAARWLLEPGSEVLFALAKETFASIENEYLPVSEARQVLAGLVEAAKQRGIKGKAIYHPLRVALSAREEGPDLYYLVGGLGKSVLLARLDKAAAYVAGQKGV